jgi:hypothetical protein
VAFIEAFRRCNRAWCENELAPRLRDAASKEKDNKSAALVLRLVEGGQLFSDLAVQASDDDDDVVVVGGDDDDNDDVDDFAKDEADG